MPILCGPAPAVLHTALLPWCEQSPTFIAHAVSPALLPLGAVHRRAAQCWRRCPFCRRCPALQSLVPLSYVHAHGYPQQGIQPRPAVPTWPPRPLAWFVRHPRCCRLCVHADLKIASPETCRPTSSACPSTKQGGAARAEWQTTRLPGGAEPRSSVSARTACARPRRPCRCAGSAGACCCRVEKAI